MSVRGSYEECEGALSTVGPAARGKEGLLKFAKDKAQEVTRPESAIQAPRLGVKPTMLNAARLNTAERHVCLTRLAFETSR
jgi:hypothetical protein